VYQFRSRSRNLRFSAVGMRICVSDALLEDLRDFREGAFRAGAFFWRNSTGRVLLGAADIGSGNQLLGQEKLHILFDHGHFFNDLAPMSLQVVYDLQH
jgi:hypothetical protein